jgi:hypothetical protein
MILRVPICPIGEPEVLSNQIADEIT